jgi:phosphomannomutase/phosphoglucomutase
MPAVIGDNIFRGYDIRGKIPDELNKEGAYRLGQAYAVYLRQRRINLAVTVRDNRIHSEQLQQAFVKALLEAGINVIDHGLGPVYFMYFSQYLNQSKGGVSVSASHNPKEYNGFKLAVGYSDTMVSDEIQALKAIAKSDQVVKDQKPGTLTQRPVFDEYLANLQRLFNDQYKFKIFLDGGNCTPALFLPKILESFGCEVISQNTKLDGNFPLGTPDPTEAEYLNRVAEGVKKNKCDLGVCYDPDGDRLGVVDDLGRPIWNDVLVALFAKDVLEYLPGAPIVFNVLCSKMVVETITSSGGKPIMWQTGHSFIKAKVKESRAPFGGELSGHFFFMDNWFGHDDAAYATLRLLAYLKRKKLSFSQAIAELPAVVSSPEIKLGLPDNIKFKFITDTLGVKLKAMFPGAEAVEIDGVRLDTKEEMVVVRASQNGPYLTIKFEAKTKDLYDQLKVKIHDLLKSHSEIDWSYGVNVDALK